MRSMEALKSSPRLLQPWKQALDRYRGCSESGSVERAEKREALGHHGGRSHDSNPPTAVWLSLGAFGRRVGHTAPENAQFFEMGSRVSAVHLDLTGECSPGDARAETRLLKHLSRRTRAEWRRPRPGPNDYINVAIRAYLDRYDPQTRRLDGNEARHCAIAWAYTATRCKAITH
jgi:hypothetical protein